ncbi:AMP-binding protein [Nocardia abscessus]|uniref:AMP-binding protein n=1 Tax=Nocardia abscessus TaxID=120957 RepID=UPI002454F9E8|nr:AMP-binding protein [Nocardia abscessus]
MSFTSPYPEVDIPDVSLYEFLFDSLTEADLERPALLDGTTGAETTYRALRDQIDAVAGALAARGLGFGEVVAVHVPNVPAFATVLHGVLRAGGTATTVHALYTSEEITKQLTDAKARFLFTISFFLPQAAAAAAAAGIPPERIFVLDGAPGHESLADLLAAGSPAPGVRLDPATHLAVLPYSSGTTGNPKGVMLTHRNLVANICQVESLTRMGAADRVMAVLPFFHIYGLSLILNTALRRRAALVTMPRFELTEFLRISAAQRCTYLMIAPPIAVALAKDPRVDDYDLSSVRVAMSGAAALDADLGNALAARLNCRVHQGYGMTEMSPASHGIPEDRVDLPLGSIGITLPNIECKLVDPVTGIEIDYPATGLSARGELCCKGPNVMPGYFGNDGATAEAFDADGFLRTGDIAVVDADGVVYLVDRVKELIKYKGYQVAPAELEAVLLTHPGIADAGVIGVKDTDGEEIPKAYVVPQPDTDLDSQQVIDFVADRVAPYKKVRRVAFVDAIPKSVTGKILRKDLRRLEAAH